MGAVPGMVEGQSRQGDGNMTTPEEAQRSVHMTWYFLHKLLDPQLTPNVPKAVRDEASWLAKHYPYPSEVYQENGMHLRNLKVSEAAK